MGEIGEIKVGEYVRTKEGKIYQYIRDLDELYFVGKDYFEPYLEDIVKHSPNIIDLIEVGDYVNGEIVIDIGERGLYLGYADDNEHYSRISIDESEINSIVTKEMFKNAEYRMETH